MKKTILIRAGGVGYFSESFRRKSKHLTSVLTCFFLTCLFLTLTSALTYAAAIGKITAFEGNVDILRRGQERAAPVMRVEEPVSEGDIVRTKSNGKTEITFTDNSVVRLAPGTRLQITEYLMEGNKRKSGIMNLFRGKVRAVVSKSRGFLGVAFGGGNRFEVRTPTAVAGVKGTDFFVFYNMGVTGIVVTDGKVDTFNPQFPNQVVPVSAGNATFIAGDKPPSAPRPANDVEVIRHTHDTDPDEKPKEGDSTITTDAGGPPADGTFGYETPGGTPPPTDTGGFAGSPLISSSDVYTDLLSDTTPPVVSIAGDTTSPVVSIAGPSPYTNLSTAAFTVTYDEPVTATYTMGSWGATATATTSDTFSIASLPEGSYTLTVTATDAAGNISTQTYSWTTDYTAPVVTTAASPDPSGATTSIITFTGSDPSAVYSYSIDGVVLTNQTSILSGLADGNHILDYTATDPAGNTTTGTLSFLLSNSTITGLVAGTGSALAGAVTGDVAAVYNQSWGGGSLGMSGSWTGPSGSSWQTTAGGSGYDSSLAWNGYWLSQAIGAYSGNIMSGTSSLTYLTYTTLGTGAGTISGSYDSTSGTFSLTEAGSFTETPLAFVSDVSGDLNTVAYYYDGSLSALLGGTTSLWSGSGVPVTYMGSYNPITTQPHVFLGTNIYSYNYTNFTYTTYDATPGAYYGFVGGTEINNVMDARLYALYIDPTGNAGYMKSSDLSGIVYPDINMFEMNGIIDRNQMTTGTGLTANQLYNNIWFGGAVDGTLSGDFGGSGGISGNDNGLYTYSIVNYANNTAELWGIYNHQFTGNFSTPGADWTAKLGGYDSMGAVNPYMSYDGQYTYADGGYYYYSYYSNNGYGYQYYYRPSTGEYSTYYYSNGTTTTYDYTTLIYTYGTWDPQTYNVSSLATPLDSGNATPSYSSSYLSGSNDYGYWLMDGTAGTWSGDKLTASVSGKYLTPYKMGNITGEMLGTYNTTDGVWQGVNMGAYDGAPLDFSGSVYGGLLWYDPALYGGVLRYANYDYWDQSWNVNGIIGGVGNLWTAGQANVYLMGTYSANSGAEPYLVYGSGWHLNYDPTVSGYSSTIGGAFSGYTVGIWNNGAINTKTLTIYIDPNGNAGYLSGPLSGNYYSGVNMWEMSGILSTEFVETTAILPADLAASLNTGGFGWYNYNMSMTGDFGGSGGVASTYIEGSLKGLSGHNWGIWNSGMGGSHTGQSGTNMSAKLGGSNFFYPEYYYGYMLGDIASNDWGVAGNTFSGSMNAQFMTGYLLGNMTGDVVGTYDGTYWQSAGVGKWDAQPLEFSGGGDLYGNYYFYDSTWNYVWSGWEWLDGNFGTTQSPFASPGTSVPLYLMGQTSTNLPGYITWWDDIEGSYYVDTNSHWYGWLGSTTNPTTNAEKGMLKALYIDAFGNAGILSGDFAGNYYPGINMWDAQGTLTANQKTSGYDPAQFWIYVDYSWPEGLGSGTFAGNTGYVELGGWLQSIYSYETATYWFINEPWGIYKLELGGYYDNPVPASTFSMALGGYWWNCYDCYTADYWLAHINGNWNSDRTIDGTITGRYLTPYALGTITGNMLGSYDTYSAGLWEGLAMGEFSETPLAWSGSVYDSSFITVTGGVAYGDGDITGLLGGTTSLWGSSPSFIAMGTYSSPSNKTLWTADMMGTTTDGASFQTITRGITLNDIVEGRTSAIYIKSDGAGGYLAGYLTGDITGTFYPGISMWETAGNLTAVDMGSTSILPSELSTPYYNINPSFKFNDSLGGTITGDISGTNRLRNISLIDQDWGIWFSWNDGTYLVTPLTNWSMTSEKIDLNYITGTQTSGTVWGTAINMLAGQTYGYGADITTTPQTWISVGETIGTFDPTAFTWQAVQTGAWLDTNKFLAMAAAGDTTGALAALNIPFVEVGRANLSGSGTMGGLPVNVYMNDTTFFAYSNGAAPKIWATNAVGGDYGCSACGSTTVGLTSTSGGTLNANFNIQTFDTSTQKWIATVAGSGTLSGGSYNGSTTFNGAAAGTNTGIGPVGTFVGTAAGTAK